MLELSSEKSGLELQQKQSSAELWWCMVWCCRAAVKAEQGGVWCVGDASAYAGAGYLMDLVHIRS